MASAGHPRSRRQGRVLLSVLAVLVVAAAGTLAWLATRSTSTSTTPTTPPTATPTTGGTPTTAAPPTGGSLAPPTVPTSGAYLGAWVNPNQGTGTVGSSQPSAPGANEVAQLPSFDARTGRAPAILHVYTPFQAPVPLAAIDTIRADGAIPLIDWHCTDVAAVAAGSDDATITAYARSLRAYGGPVFLRWYWEMNLDDRGNDACGGYADPAGYVAAWRHIYGLFRQAGATNVSFVWCPSIQKPWDAFYPGDGYVDWIGIDGYDRKGLGSAGFAALFSGYYAEFAPHGKPLMVAETAAFASPSDGSAEQAQYLAGMGTTAPSQFPDIKAVVYFDSIGPSGNWSLQGSGLTEFATLGRSSWFGYRGNA